jgi:hypothetical protein
MGDDRPVRYVEADGTVVYRASGLGVCDGIMMGLARGRKPNAVPEWMQEVFDEGHRMESVIINELLGLNQYAHLDLDHQTEFTLDIGEINDRQVIVRGHCDGWDIADETIVEAKKFRPSTWPKFQRQGIECNPLYPWQVSVYMHAARQLGIYARTLFVGGAFNPDTDGIDEIGVFDLPEPPLSLKGIRKRIARWENMIEAGMDVTDIAECVPRMYPCAMFGKGCPSETKADEPVELTGAWAERGKPIIAEMEKQARIARNFQRGVDEAKKAKKEQEDALRDLLDDMVEAGFDVAKKISVDGVTVTHVTGDVPEKVTKGYQLNYFTIKEAKEATS